MNALEVYHTVDVLTLWIWFETQCPVEKKKKENLIKKKKMSFMPLFLTPPQCDPILHYVVVPQDFYESQWKALLLYQLELLHVFKKCCFNCFDKEINLLPVNCCLSVLSYALKLKAGFVNGQ